MRLRTWAAEQYSRWQHSFWSISVYIPGVVWGAPSPTNGRPEVHLCGRPDQSTLFEGNPSQVRGEVALLWSVRQAIVISLWAIDSTNWALVSWSGPESHQWYHEIGYRKSDIEYRKSWLLSISSAWYPNEADLKADWKRGKSSFNRLLDH